MTKKLLVYGTLRRGGSNYPYFNIKYKETKRIKGFDMYTLGPYPYVVQGDGEITVDVVEVDESNYNSITAMERGAGYEILEVEDAELYYFTDKVNEEEVESGDWIMERGQ